MIFVYSISVGAFRVRPDQVKHRQADVKPACRIMGRDHSLLGSFSFATPREAFGLREAM